MVFCIKCYGDNVNNVQCKRDQVVCSTFFDQYVNVTKWYVRPVCKRDQVVCSTLLVSCNRSHVAIINSEAVNKRDKVMC